MCPAIFVYHDQLACDLYLDKVKFMSKAGVLISLRVGFVLPSFLLIKRLTCVLRDESDLPSGNFASLFRSLREDNRKKATQPAVDPSGLLVA